MSTRTVQRRRVDKTAGLAVSVERLCREELLIQRGQLLRLRSQIADGIDDGSVRLDAAKLTRLEAAAQLGAVEARLASVDAALDRLRAGEFGVCRECGDRVPEARLEARPDAEFCVPCCERQRRST